MVMKNCPGNIGDTENCRAPSWRQTDWSLTDFVADHLMGEEAPRGIGGKSILRF